MTTPEDSIRARRRLTNRLIAGKDAARLAPFFDPAVTLIVGDGAVIDHEFNSTDVFIIVKTELVTEKYIRHYERGMRDQHN